MALWWDWQRPGNARQRRERQRRSRSKSKENYKKRLKEEADEDTKQLIIDRMHRVQTQRQSPRKITHSQKAGDTTPATRHFC